MSRRIDLPDHSTFWRHFPGIAQDLVSTARATEPPARAVSPSPRPSWPPQALGGPASLCWVSPCVGVVGNGPEVAGQRVVVALSVVVVGLSGWYSVRVLGLLRSVLWV